MGRIHEYRQSITLVFDNGSRMASKFQANFAVGKYSIQLQSFDAASAGKQLSEQFKKFRHPKSVFVGRTKFEYCNGSCSCHPLGCVMQCMC